MLTLTAFTSQLFLGLFKYFIFLKDYGLLIISNIRYSKRYTVTDKNAFLSVSRKCFQGLSLISSTNILYFLEIMDYLYYQSSDIARDVLALLIIMFFFLFLVNVMSAAFTSHTCLCPTRQQPLTSSYCLRCDVWAEET